MTIGIDEDEVEKYFMEDLENMCSSFVKNDDELLACIHGFYSGAIHVMSNVEQVIPPKCREQIVFFIFHTDCISP